MSGFYLENFFWGEVFAKSARRDVIDSISYENALLSFGSSIKTDL